MNEMPNNEAAAKIQDEGMYMSMPILVGHLEACQGSTDRKDQKKSEILGRIPGITGDADSWRVHKTMTHGVVWLEPQLLHFSRSPFPQFRDYLQMPRGCEDIWVAKPGHRLHAVSWIQSEITHYLRVHDELKSDPHEESPFDWTARTMDEDRQLVKGAMMALVYGAHVLANTKHFENRVPTVEEAEAYLVELRRVHAGLRLIYPKSYAQSGHDGAGTEMFEHLQGEVWNRIRELLSYEIPVGYVKHDVIAVNVPLDDDGMQITRIWARDYPYAVGDLVTMNNGGVLPKRKKRWNHLRP